MSQVEKTIKIIFQMIALLPIWFAGAWVQGETVQFKGKVTSASPDNGSVVVQHLSTGYEVQLHVDPSTAISLKKEIDLDEVMVGNPIQLWAVERVRHFSSAD